MSKIEIKTQPYIANKIGEYFDNPNNTNEAGRALAHAALGVASAYLSGNDALSTAAGAVAGEALAKPLGEILGYGDNPQHYTTKQKETLSNIISLGSAAIGATTGKSTDVVSSSVAGSVPVEDNAFYMYKNKLVATDRVNDKTVVDLTTKELLRLGLLSAYLNKNIVNPLFISKQDLSQFTNVYNLSNNDSFDALRTKYTDHYYNNINSDVKQVFMNGMNNSLADAYASVNLIQKDFGTTGLISNTTDRTFGVLGDALEWLPNYITTQDVLDEYMLSKLAPGTEVITHSAGNENIFKDYKVASYINEKLPLNIISVGSPRSATDLQNIGYPNGMLSIYQYNDPYDPVANGLLNNNASYKPTLYFWKDLGKHHPFINYYYSVVKPQLKKAQR